MAAPLVLLGYGLVETAPVWGPEALAALNLVAAGTALGVLGSGTSNSEASQPNLLLFKDRGSKNPIDGYCSQTGTNSGGGAGQPPKPDLGASIAASAWVLKQIQSGQPQAEVEIEIPRHVRVQRFAQEICEEQGWDGVDGAEWDRCLEAAEARTPADLSPPKMTVSYIDPLPSVAVVPQASDRNTRASQMAATLDVSEEYRSRKGEVETFLRTCHEPIYADIVWLFDRLAADARTQRKLLILAVTYNRYSLPDRAFAFNFLRHHYDDYFDPTDTAHADCASLSLVISSLVKAEDFGFLNEMRAVEALEKIEGVQVVRLNKLIPEAGTEMDVILDVTGTDERSRRICVAIKTSPGSTSRPSIKRQIDAAEHLGDPLLFLFWQHATFEPGVQNCQTLNVPYMFGDDLRSMTADKLIQSVGY